MKIKNLSFSYGERPLLNNINLDIEANKTLCILGVSGCGKTTFLNCIGGLIKYSGQIEGLPEKISYVFQESRLVPSLTVRENLAYVLGDIPKIRRNVLIDGILSDVELIDSSEKYPHALSGGERSRISLARAFVYPSSLILMDEPFTGLDIALKSRIITLFNSLLAEKPKTVVYVTHSIDEALLLSDRVCVMDASGGLSDCLCIPHEKPKRSIVAPELVTARKRLLESLIRS